MSSELLLAIDAGKTTTRAVVVTAGRRGEVVRGPGIDNIAAAGADRRISAALASTLEPLQLGTIDGVCLGATGVLDPGKHAGMVLDLLVALVHARRTVVTSDVVTSFCGALGPRSGVVVAAGTGAITLGVGPDGTLTRVDGWGYLLDDGGSAFEIGRAGLRQALRAHDGRGGSATLQRAAFERFGSPAELVHAVYGSDNAVRTVASFAEPVSHAADAGDPVAAQILATAATALADSVVAAAQASFPAGHAVPVSWCGGVFRAGRRVTEPFRDRVVQELPVADLVEPAGDALDGAAALAGTDGASVVDGLLLTSERSRS